MIHKGRNRSFTAIDLYQRSLIQSHAANLNLQMGRLELRKKTDALILGRSFGRSSDVVLCEIQRKFQEAPSSPPLSCLFTSSYIHPGYYSSSMKLLFTDASVLLALLISLTLEPFVLRKLGTHPSSLSYIH